MEEPPSRAWWELDSYLNGHTPAETIWYESWASDYADEQQDRRRSLPAGFVPAECEPRWLTTVRRWFGR